MVAFLFEIIVLIPFYSHEITGKMMLRHGALGDLPKELGPYGTNGLRGSFTTISRYSRGGYHWKALCQSWSCGRNFSMLICPSIPSTLCASCFNTSADWENIPGKNWKDQESWEKNISKPHYIKQYGSSTFLKFSEETSTAKQRDSWRPPATQPIASPLHRSRPSGPAAAVSSFRTISSRQTENVGSSQHHPTISQASCPTHSQPWEIPASDQVDVGPLNDIWIHPDVIEMDRDGLPSSSKSASKSWGSAVVSCSRSASVAFKTCRSPQQLMDEPSVWAEISKFGLELLGRTTFFWWKKYIQITLLRVIPTMTFQNSLLTPLLSEAFVTGLLPN